MSPLDSIEPKGKKITVSGGTVNEKQLRIVLPCDLLFLREGSAKIGTILLVNKITGTLFQCGRCNNFIAAVASLGGSVGCASDWRPGGHRFDPR